MTLPELLYVTEEQALAMCVDSGQAVGVLLVHEDQAQLNREEGWGVRQQKRLPGWELEGPSVIMPCDFLRRDFPWGSEEGFPWSKGYM